MPALRTGPFTARAPGSGDVKQAAKRADKIAVDYRCGAAACVLIDDVMLISWRACRGGSQRCRADLTSLTRINAKPEREKGLCKTAVQARSDTLALVFVFA